MAYILGLFLILGIVFYSAGHFGLSGNLFSGIKNTVKNNIDLAKSKLYTSIFPKSEREILIENLDSDYNLLDKFFKDTAPKILESKEISEQDKQAIRQASAKFSQTKKAFDIIKSLEKNDKGIIEKLVDKFFKDDIPAAEPTSIPPQCRLECGD